MRYLLELKKTTLIGIGILLIISCNQKLVKQKMDKSIKYPIIKVESVTDDYFGKKIEDKYRGLENVEDKAVQNWIEKENDFTDSIINKITYRDSLQKMIQELIYSSNTRGGFPRPAGKKIFFYRTYAKEKVQKIFYKDSLSSTYEIELYSTASINKEGRLFNIDYYEPSFDGKYLAFGLSVNGDEKTVCRIIDIEQKRILPDSIERAAFGKPFWIPNGNAFFYAQSKEIKTEADEKTLYEDSKVKLHYIGANPNMDKDVFSREVNKELKLEKIDFTIVGTFPNSDKVIASMVRGATRYMSLYWADLKDLTAEGAVKENSWKTICTPEEKITNFVLSKNELFVLCTKDNPNGSIRKYDLIKSSSNSTLILEGKDDVLEDIMGSKNAIYIKRNKGGINSLIQINSNGINEIKLPFGGQMYFSPVSFEITSSYSHSDDLYFAMESWNKEIGVYCYNYLDKTIHKTDLRPSGKYGNLNELIVKEVDVPSHDGELVPLSIIYFNDIKFNGQNPTLMTAYGAYGISTNASFSFPLIAWFKMGGIYAVAHVRGGGEKGEKWYKGGYKKTKPNSWKDFISCAEYLIQKKYTSANKLTARGTSAGGITVGRAITERPELFKAAILEVSPLNIIRSEKSRNTLSVAEFGSPKDSTDFENLYNMDVYHHIKKGVIYPSLLITAGLNDARVDWWKVAKGAARFQEVSQGKNNVVLFRISGFGHTGGPDFTKTEADCYSFLLWQLNHPKFSIAK